MKFFLKKRDGLWVAYDFRGRYYLFGEDWTSVVKRALEFFSGRYA